MASKLYVGNLAYSVTNADLEALFSQAGVSPSLTKPLVPIMPLARSHSHVRSAQAR